MKVELWLLALCVARVRLGDGYVMRDLIDEMMLVSDNDAAMASPSIWCCSTAAACPPASRSRPSCSTMASG